MYKIILCAAALLLVSCERRVVISNNLTSIGQGYFLKEIMIQTENGSNRYIYILVNSDGDPLQGTSTTYRSGKVNNSATSIVIPDSSEYYVYKRLKEKYERAER